LFRIFFDIFDAFVSLIRPSADHGIQLLDKIVYPPFSSSSSSLGSSTLFSLSSLESPLDLFFPFNEGNVDDVSDVRPTGFNIIGFERMAQSTTQMAIATGTAAATTTSSSSNKSEYRPGLSLSQLSN
jgi:hypothetical protein